MYVGDNKVALTSQNLIAEAMNTLLQTHPFADISISMLCKQAGVSRQTFYSLFGSKESVIIYELSNHCRYTPKHKNECHKENLESLCQNYSEYIIANRTVIEMLVRNDMMGCLYDMQQTCFQTCDGFMPDLDKVERGFVVDFVANGLCSIAKSYVLTGGTLSQDELSRLIFKIFNGSYFV